MERANHRDANNEGFGPFVTPSLELAAPAGAAPESETARVTARAESSTEGNPMSNYLPPSAAKQSRGRRWARFLCGFAEVALLAVCVVGLVSEATEVPAGLRKSCGVSA